MSLAVQTTSRHAPSPATSSAYEELIAKLDKAQSLMIDISEKRERSPQSIQKRLSEITGDPEIKVPIGQNALHLLIQEHLEKTPVSLRQTPRGSETSYGDLAHTRTSLADKYNVSGKTIYRWARFGLFHLASTGTKGVQKVYLERTVSRFEREQSDLIEYATSFTKVTAEEREAMVGRVKTKLASGAKIGEALRDVARDAGRTIETVKSLSVKDEVISPEPFRKENAVKKVEINYIDSPDFRMTSYQLAAEVKLEWSKSEKTNHDEVNLWFKRYNYYKFRAAEAMKLDFKSAFPWIERAYETRNEIAQKFASYFDKLEGTAEFPKGRLPLFDAIESFNFAGEVTFVAHVLKDLRSIRDCQDEINRRDLSRTRYIKTGSLDKFPAPPLQTSRIGDFQRGAMIGQLIRGLEPGERIVIEERFLPRPGKKIPSQKDLATKLRLTPKEVSVLENRAIRKMRSRAEDLGYSFDDVQVQTVT